MGIPAIDWGRSGRVDEYECWLVDPFSLEDRGKVDIDAASSGVTYAYYTDTQYSATIAVLDDIAKDSLLRLKHAVTIDGVRYGEEMGTFFAASKSMTALHGRVSRSMDCYSTLLRHSEDSLIFTHNYYVGDNCAGILQQVVEADGGHLVFGPGAPTSRTHTVNGHWDIGTNKLEMLTTLAGWIGGEISATAHGEVQLDAYTVPSDRPVQWTFEAGRNCIYRPGFTSSEDEGDVYNRALFYYSTDEGAGSAYADLADSSPYSYARMGRHVTYSEQLGETATDGELRDKCTGFLQEHGGGAIYYEIEHAGIPGLKPGMMVRYVNEGDYPTRIDAHCLVTEMSVDSLAPMCMTKTKMRAVY